jgi:hypothetical protein
MVCKSTKTRNKMSFVLDLNRAKEYAANAEIKIGINVAGIVTIKELSIALLSGTVVVPTQASTKFWKVKVNGLTFHQPNCTSLNGRIDAMNTPRKGINQMSAMSQAATCATTVESVIFGFFEGNLILKDLILLKNVKTRFFAFSKREDMAAFKILTSC